MLHSPSSGVAAGAAWIPAARSAPRAIAAHATAVAHAAPTNTVVRWSLVICRLVENRAATASYSPAAGRDSTKNAEFVQRRCLLGAALATAAAHVERPYDADGLRLPSARSSTGHPDRSGLTLGSWPYAPITTIFPMSI